MYLNICWVLRDVFRGDSGESMLTEQHISKKYHYLLRLTVKS